jgi:hypothetical protein
VPERHAAIKQLRTGAEVCVGDAKCSTFGSQPQPPECSASCVWQSDKHPNAEPLQQQVRSMARDNVCPDRHNDAQPVAKQIGNDPSRSWIVPHSPQVSKFVAKLHCESSVGPVDSDFCCLAVRFCFRRITNVVVFAIKPFISHDPDKIYFCSEISNQNPPESHKVSFGRRVDEFGQTS